MISQIVVRMIVLYNRKFPPGTDYLFDQIHLHLNKVSMVVDRWETKPWITKWVSN